MGGRAARADPPQPHSSSGRTRRASCLAAYLLQFGILHPNSRNMGSASSIVTGRSVAVCSKRPLRTFPSPKTRSPSMPSASATTRPAPATCSTLSRASPPATTASRILTRTAKGPRCSGLHEDIDRTCSKPTTGPKSRCRPTRPGTEGAKGRPESFEDEIINCHFVLNAQRAREKGAWGSPSCSGRGREVKRYRHVEGVARGHEEQGCRFDHRRSLATQN